MKTRTKVLELVGLSYSGAQLMAQKSKKQQKTWIFLAIISHFIPLINKQINNMQNLTNNFSENFYFTRCITKLGDEFRYLLGPIWVFFLFLLMFWQSLFILNYHFHDFYINSFISLISQFQKFNLFIHSFIQMFCLYQ